MKLNTYTYLLVSLILIACFSSKLNAQKLLLSGEIVSPADTPIDGVHILNTNTNELAITDQSGFFSLSMHKTHVLRISAVGFKTYYYSLRHPINTDINYVRITLQAVTVALKNIDIIAKEEPRAENLFRPKPLPSPFSFGYQGIQHGVKPTAMNPISLLYNWLSKEGKQNKKLEELLNEDEVKKIVSQRYESDIIWELTGYTGKELENLKKHCNLSDYFVANSSDYDFLYRIKKCYNSYIPLE